MYPDTGLSWVFLRVFKLWGYFKLGILKWNLQSWGNSLWISFQVKSNWSGIKGKYLKIRGGKMFVGKKRTGRLQIPNLCFTAKFCLVPGEYFEVRMQTILTPCNNILTVLESISGSLPNCRTIYSKTRFGMEGLI